MQQTRSGESFLTDLLHPEETITTFFLLRHGHTEATEQGRLYTDPKVPLTHRGLEQAHAAAKWLGMQKIECLLTSPAVRVRSTADIVGAELSMKPVVVDGFEEWHIGDWEGRTYLDLKKHEPDLYKAWSEDPIHNAPPGGESISDVHRRVGKNLAGLIQKYEGRQIAFVSHAGIIRSILIHALEMKVENFWRIVIPTGSVSRVDFSENFASVHFMSYRPAV